MRPSPLTSADRQNLTYSKNPWTDDPKPVPVRRNRRMAMGVRHHVDSTRLCRITHALQVPTKHAQAKVYQAIHNHADHSTEPLRLLHPRLGFGGKITKQPNRIAIITYTVSGFCHSDADLDRPASAIVVIHLVP